jgi:long-subunit acyl-CoA synthetase (AMP-forming)
VALIVLDRDGLSAFCAEHAVADTDLATLARDEQVLRAIDIAVQAGNAKLSCVEQIKRYAVLDHDWQPSSDTLTPTALLKRAAIEQRYQGIIDQLYA